MHHNVLGWPGWAQKGIPEGYQVSEPYGQFRMLQLIPSGIPSLPESALLSYPRHCLDMLCRLHAVRSNLITPRPGPGPGWPGQPAAQHGMIGIHTARPLRDQTTRRERGPMV